MKGIPSYGYTLAAEYKTLYYNSLQAIPFSGGGDRCAFLEPAYSGRSAEETSPR